MSRLPRTSRLNADRGDLAEPVAFRMSFEAAKPGEASATAPPQNTPAPTWPGGAITIGRDEPPPGLWYVHLGKTGGSFMRWALPRLIEGGVGVVDEAAGLRDTPRLPFVLGGMRNPCDFYVSVW